MPLARPVVVRPPSPTHGHQQLIMTPLQGHYCASSGRVESVAWRVILPYEFIMSNALIDAQCTEALDATTRGYSPQLASRYIIVHI